RRGPRLPDRPWRPGGLRRGDRRGDDRGRQECQRRGARASGRPPATHRSRARLRGGGGALAGATRMSMDFGIFSMFTTRVGDTQAFKEWLALVQLAAEVGLDPFWFGESHFRPERAVLASPLIGASAAAARTRCIRIGLAVQVLPLAHPLTVAEEAAIVDHISEGRLVFGVGRSSFLESYQGYNIDHAESRDRFDESLDIILKAWCDAPV